MTLVLVSSRMEPDLKKKFDKTCKALGMNMSTAINMFATAMVREQRFPCDLSIGSHAVSDEVALALSEELLEKNDEAYRVLAQ